MTKIVGIGVCGEGEASRYMEKTLKEFERLCDYTLIVVNGNFKPEIELIEKYGFQYYIDEREWGKFQPAIKTDLLKFAGEMFHPDWVVALDMDEVFAPEFTREKAEELIANQPDEIAYHFMIVNLYNDEQHFAHSTGIQRFWNIRFYKFAPEYGLQFQRKALHCGLAPPIAYKYGWYAPYYVLHYGLMKPEDREAKARRYDKYDPHKIHKQGNYYEELRADLPMRLWDAKGLLAKLADARECKPRKTPKIRPE